MSEQLSERYQRALHAMQAGVRLELEHDVRSANGGFLSQVTHEEIIRLIKHLRVGNNARAVDQSGLVALLINKGVLTLAEYHESMTAAMEQEVERYETYLHERGIIPLNARLGGMLNGELR
jgi:hypothetical protein